MGCGCGKRAVKLVRVLGVPMAEEYVQKHHVRATLKALGIWLRRTIGRSR